MNHAKHNQADCVALDIEHLKRIVEEVRARTEEALDDLIAQLGAASISEDEFDFGGLLRAAKQLLRLDNDQLAEILNVSRPTVSRWIRGLSAPHPLGRKAIFDALKFRAEATVKGFRPKN